MVVRGERLAGVWVLRRLPEFYVALALLVAGSLCILTPWFNATDEGNHARRALQIAHGQLLPAGTSAAEDSNFLYVANEMGRLRDDLMARVPEGSWFPDGRYTAAQLHAVQGLRWSHHEEWTTFQNTAIYPPVFYLPAAVGFASCEAADLTITRSMMVARFAQTLFAVALGWMTLRLCGSGRWIMFAYLLLPTVLNLGASCSQDGLLLPAAALATVLVLRALEARRSLSGGEVASITALLVLCAGARITYLPLVVVLLLPSIEAGEDRMRKFARSLLGMMVVVVCIGAWQFAVRSLGTFTFPTANPSRQWLLLRTHPAHGLLSLLDALTKVIPPMLFKGLFLIGANDAEPPHRLRAVMMLALLGIVLLDRSIGLRRWTSRIVLSVTLFGVVCGTYLAEYLIWTPPGALRVSGLQGRYFVPLIPLFLVLLSPALTGLRRWISPSMIAVQDRLLLASAGVYCAGVAMIPLIAAHVFYRASVSEAFHILLR